MIRRFILLALIPFASLSQVSHSSAQTFIDADPCVGKLGFQPILRQDFTDVPILGCASATDLKAAVGARVSYTYDDIHKTSGGSLDGLAALNFQYSINGLSEYISRISFGPYAQGSGQHVFGTATMAATNTGTVTAGGFVQFFVEQPLPFVLRLRGGELSDNTRVRDGVAIGELMPTFRLMDLLGEGVLPSRLGGFAFGSEYVLDNGIRFVFSPELEAQYDSFQRGPPTYALFTAHHESMRVGPLLVLKLYGFESFVGSSTPFYKQLQNTAVSITYHADWDTFSNQRYYSFQPAIIYNFYDSGNYAMTVSYSIGDAEFSGNRSRQA